VRRTHCRGCGSAHIFTVYDFGPQPLAGNFPTQPESRQPTRKYPLDLAECPDCTLLQVTHLPPIDEIFHGDYRYASSTVPGLRRHFEEYANWLAERIAPGARVIEFGCNDGILLEKLAAKSFECHGVDASRNMVELARAKGLSVDEAFFTPQYVADHGLSGKFKLVTCSNVYAHMDDLGKTTQAVSMVLADGGMFCVEVHDGDTIASQNQFDTIYHEHLSYFTETSIARHLAAHGFAVDQVLRTTMHGGGLRILARKINGSALPTAAVVPTPSVLRESLSGAIEQATSNIRMLQREYGPLFGYGAAGRAQMFLNFTGTAGMFKKVFDDSPLRQNRYIAGTDLPIARFDGREGPGACVVLAWNYASDIAVRIGQDFDAVFTVLPELKRWI